MLLSLPASKPRKEVKLLKCLIDFAVIYQIEVLHLLTPFGGDFEFKLFLWCMCMGLASLVGTGNLQSSV